MPPHCPYSGTSCAVLIEMSDMKAKPYRRFIAMKFWGWDLEYWKKSFTYLLFEVRKGKARPRSIDGVAQYDNPTRALSARNSKAHEKVSWIFEAARVLQQEFACKGVNEGKVALPDDCDAPTLHWSMSRLHASNGRHQATFRRDKSSSVWMFTLSKCQSF